MSNEMHNSRLVVRSAHTGDVPSIRRLVDMFTLDRRLLSKATVALYEDVPEFVVAQIGDRVVGCGALHVMWEDLAEVRTLAVDPAEAGKGIGSAILSELLNRANEFGVQRVFVLTFEVSFFRRFGFEEIDGAPVSHAVFEQLLQSYDEGVAEFLDLERVKPNTLGNSRLLLLL
ncbi:MAG: amino-acid N-acetyltransferase [Actinomycetes bacterium]